MQARELVDMENRDPNNVNDHLKVLRTGSSCFCLLRMYGFVVVLLFCLRGFVAVVVLFVLSLFVLLGEGGGNVCFIATANKRTSCCCFRCSCCCFVFLMSFDIALV